MLDEESGLAGVASRWVGVGGERERGGVGSWLLEPWGGRLSSWDAAAEEARDASFRTGRGDTGLFELGEPRSRLSEGPGDRTCSLRWFMRYKFILFYYQLRFITFNSRTLDAFIKNLAGTSY